MEHLDEDGVVRIHKERIGSLIELALQTEKAKSYHALPVGQFFVYKEYCGIYLKTALGDPILVDFWQNPTCIQRDLIGKKINSTPHLQGLSVYPLGVDFFIEEHAIVRRNM